MSREPAVDRGRIRGYLLRRLGDDERQSFEESYFADDALLDRVEAEEDLLVTDYVLGRLSEDDRRRFEQALLGTPYYRERVETTTRLRRRIARDQGVRNLGRGAAPRPGGGLFPGRTGIVVAIGLLCVLLLAALVTALRLKQQVATLRAELSTAAPAPVTAAGGGVVPSTPSVVLQPTDGAGVSVRRMERLAGSPLVLIFPRDLLPDDARIWRVVLREESGAVIWDSGDQIAPAAASADLAVRLPPGVPSGGRSGVTLWSGGTPVFSVLLQIAEPPSAASR